MDDMNEFRQIFFTECAELLSDMEGRLLKLNINTEDKEELNAIFRCAHSIKGGAGAFGLDTIMRFTHILEALLDAMREGSLLPGREVIDTLLKSVDIVTRMLDTAREGREISTGFGADVAEALQGFIRDKSILVATRTAVIAMPDEERHYDIRFADASGDTLLPIIRRKVLPDSIVCTDG